MNSDSHDQLAEVRNNIINSALGIGFLVAVSAYLLSLLTYFDNGFELSYITDLLVIVVIGYITLKRKKLSLQTKSYVVLVCIFLVVMVDIVELGVLSANKVLLILIPFFSLISLSIRKSIFLFVVTIVAISVIAGFHMTGMIESPVIDDFGIVAWLINILLITLVTFVILIIVMRFNETYEKLIEDLYHRNRDLKSSRREIAIYRDELEELVDQRTAELNATNKKLSRQATKLRKTIEQLNHTKEELVESEKMSALGSLSAGVAHEINNPLNFIKAGVENIEVYLSKDLDEERQAYLEPLFDAVKEGVLRSAQIVSSLSQYEISKEKEEQCDVNDIVENCLDILKDRLGRTIRITRDLEKKLPSLMVDKGRLYQLFLNLLTNAIDAIEGEGDIVVKTSLKDSTLLSVLIKDSGMGISKKNLARISEPFFTTKEVGSGTGLGLYTSFNIVKHYHGKIRFESKEGSGTLVEVTLPVAYG